MRNRLTQNKILSSKRFEHELIYWKNQLAGAEPAQIEPDLFGSGERTRGQLRAASPFRKGFYDKLLVMGNSSPVAVLVLLVAAVKLFVYKWTENESPVIGMPVVVGGGAREEELLNHTLALVTRMDNPRMIFRDWVYRVKQTIDGALRHQNYPFEALAEEFQNFGFPEGVFPLPVMVFLDGIHNEDHLRGTNPELLIRFRPDGSNLAVELVSPTCGYYPETLVMLAERIVHFTEKLIDDTHMEVSRAGLISKPELEMILERAGSPPVPLQELRLHERFERQAGLTPDRTAVACGEHSRTYRELNEAANRLAFHLIGQGVGADDLVAVLMHRSIETVVSIFAIWKAGGAYLPIDPSYPEERIRELLEDSGTKHVILKGREVKVPVHDKGWTLVDLEESASLLAASSSDNLNISMRPDQLAYVIYTSGSTGKPKGAMIEQLGKQNHIEAMINSLDLDENAVIAQNAPPCFDISVWQLITAGMTGGKTVIYENGLIRNPREFLQQVVKDRVTVLEVVVTYMTAILDLEEPVPLPDLRTVLVTGETISPALARRWFVVYPHIRLVNAYGPSEAADDVTLQLMEHCPEDLEIVPIGKPIQNMRVYIVNDRMELVPLGARGELCVAGVGVGRGYLGNPEKTAQVFLDDPFVSVPKRRLYRTGDLARWRPDGTLEYLGRMDFQVKIRGHRIELGEVENKLLEHPAVKEVVLVATKGADGLDRLCTYWVKQQGIPGIVKLREYLAARLPEYMIPSFIVELEALPLTPNGKVDRKALPKPEITAVAAAEAPVDEEEAELLAIWRKVMGVEALGVTDDFFDWGGNSLKAFALSASIQKATGVELPLTAVFEARTVRALAPLVAKRKHAAPEGTEEIAEVCLKLSGDGANPLFCFPSVFGYGTQFASLSALLPGTTVYGFHFIPEENRLDKYAECIRKRSEGEPVVLLGYSAGGNLAYELAKVLEAQGVPVSDLILLDSKRRLEPDIRSEEELQQLCGYYMDRLSEHGLDEVMKVPGQRDRLAERVAEFTRYHRQQANLGEIKARIHLLQAGEQTKENTWVGATFGDCRTYEGYGYHFDMLDRGFVERNAGTIGSILDEVRRIGRHREVEGWRT